MPVEAPKTRFRWLRGHRKRSKVTKSTPARKLGSRFGVILFYSLTRAVDAVAAYRSRRGETVKTEEGRLNPPQRQINVEASAARSGDSLAPGVYHERRSLKFRVCRWGEGALMRLIPPPLLTLHPHSSCKYPPHRPKKKSYQTHCAGRSSDYTFPLKHGVKSMYRAGSEP